MREPATGSRAAPPAPGPLGSEPPPDGARFDLIVLGSGIAGLYAALQAREHGASVLLLTKSAIDEANTRHAQGGIAAAIGPDDSIEAHLRDTIEAGAGLVDESAARVLVTEAAARIADLVRYGVHFDEVHGQAALGREAAHSAARILHAGGDATGMEIELSLSTLARHAVTVVEHAQAERLLTAGDGAERRITGVEALLAAHGGRTVRYASEQVVLATGGVGQLYSITTNPPVATGDGISLAYRAGAEVMDLEFTQFHPTALRLPGAPVFLISEAVRGEGARLLNVHGERYMPRYHDLAELAPRDVVARATFREMRLTGADHVLLDITGRDPGWLVARFPQISRTCLEYGLDIVRDRIPVSPAAHYTMGGVRTDTWGQTTLRGLYAVGEVMCSGVHGANRLASNSLLETVVFAHRTVERLLSPPEPAPPLPAPTPDAIHLDPAAVIEAAPLPGSGPPSLEAVRRLMWSHVGIERTADELLVAVATLRWWIGEYASGVLPPPQDRAGFELRSLLDCGLLAAEAALRREESRGAHFRVDYPEPREEWRRHLVFRTT